MVQAWECANKLGLIGPAMEQPQYNMFEREKVQCTLHTLMCNDPLFSCCGAELGHAFEVIDQIH